uniref:Transthyretin-like family-containing protein n=1 Tax=Strongyloides papillosus TaxID=174720 RepID=A0A0N5BGL5_STREA
MNFITIIFILLIFVQNSLEGRGFKRIQVVGVKGKILCKGRNYGTTRVKLTNHISFRNISVMDSISSKKNGDFYVRGHHFGYYFIRPFLEIFHKCYHRGYQCYRKISIRVPADYIFKGPIIKDFYDVGTINLAKNGYQSKICSKPY